MIWIQIQTNRARDTPQTNIFRDGIETQKKAVGAANKYHIKSVKKTEIQTAWGEKDIVLKNPNVNREERIRQIQQIKRRRDYFKNGKVKLSRKKYAFAKKEDEAPNNIASVEATVSAAQGVVHTGGVIRTAVGGTRNTAAAFKSIAENAVKESGHSLLRTKVDKNTTTDTGTEAVKQGITELRYADNVRKAVYNTAVGGIKTARSIKETPKAVKNDVKKIREKIIRKNRAKQIANSKKSSKAAGSAAKKIASVAAKVVTSKGFIVIALAGGLILLVTTLLSGFVSVIVSSVSSMFSWATPKDDTTQSDYLQAYHTQVQNIQSDIQEEIDSNYEYTAEYRYDGSEITSLDQYGNLTLSVDENAVIAAAAVKEFQVGNDTISDETISEVIEFFYTYSYSTETGYCPDFDCMKDESVKQKISDGDFSISNTAYMAGTDQYAVTFKGSCYEHTLSVWTELTIGTSDGTITGTAYAEVSGSDWEVTYNIGSDSYNDIDWNDITIKTTTIYCDNPGHTIYRGEVVNLDAETGLDDLGFSDDEKSMFWTYYALLEQGGF